MSNDSDFLNGKTTPPTSQNDANSKSLINWAGKDQIKISDDFDSYDDETARSLGIID